MYVQIEMSWTVHRLLIIWAKINGKVPKITFECPQSEKVQILNVY